MCRVCSVKRSPGAFTSNERSKPSSGCSVITSTLVCVAQPSSATEQRNRRAAEVDRDLGRAPGEALAGAQMERDALPAPVVDLEAQADEGLGRASARRRRAPDGSPAASCRSPSGARTGPNTTASSRIGATERSTFTFSKRMLSASKAAGDLHRGQGEQLREVVLHHVAQRAGLLVVAARAARCRAPRPR